MNTPRTNASRTPQQILDDPEFLAFARRKNRVSLLLTLLTIAVYYGFITLLAFGKETMGHKISGSITLGIPIGIGVILLSWLFTGLYVRWANTHYDADVARFKAQAEGVQAEGVQAEGE